MHFSYLGKSLKNSIAVETGLLHSLPFTKTIFTSSLLWNRRILKCCFRKLWLAGFQKSVALKFRIFLTKRWRRPCLVFVLVLSMKKPFSSTWLFKIMLTLMDYF